MRHIICVLGLFVICIVLYVSVLEKTFISPQKNCCKLIDILEHLLNSIIVFQKMQNCVVFSLWATELRWTYKMQKSLLLCASLLARVSISSRTRTERQGSCLFSASLCLNSRAKLGRAESITFVAYSSYLAKRKQDLGNRDFFRASELAKRALELGELGSFCLFSKINVFITWQTKSLAICF